MTKDQKCRRRSSWTRLLLFMAVCLAYLVVQMQQASAILNCFTPKMFNNKLGKGGQQVNPYPGGGGPERTNWYPQLYSQQSYNQYPYQQPQYPYQYPSMKALMFQSKWKGGGGSLFGLNKNWGSNWKQQMGGANSNFYRPGFGYGYSTGGGSSLFATPMARYPHSMAGYGGGMPSYNQHSSDMLLSYPGSAAHTTAGGYSPVLNSYSTAAGSGGSGGVNDGWTIPSHLGHNSGYTSTGSQRVILKQPTIDPYNSVKGGTTKKGNILLADGGYNAYDAHLVQDPYLSSLHRNRTTNPSYGYSYPDSYSGVVDSPAKIAQQLMKYGFRQQRLQQQQTFARLAPLLLASNSSSGISSSGSRLTTTLTEEPKFVGFGLVDVLSNREARLSCSFNEPIERISPLWIKFIGSYNSTQMSGANIVPPFDCPSVQCRTQEIDSIRDPRFRFDNGPATSTLIISEPRTSDYGVYRCSATGKTISITNNNNSNTIYKIVQLGDTL